MWVSHIGGEPFMNAACESLPLATSRSDYLVSEKEILRCATIEPHSLERSKIGDLEGVRVAISQRVSDRVIVDRVQDSDNVTLKRCELSHAIDCARVDLEPSIR